MRTNATQRKIKRLRESAKHAASVRWKREDARRELLASLDPIRVGRIVRRVIVIQNETTAKERVFYEFDRDCDWKRKMKEVFR